MISIPSAQKNDVNISTLFANFCTRFTYLFSIKDILSDLQRLAETSPHLLVDLGFTQTITVDQPRIEIWQKDDIIISLERVGTAPLAQVKRVSPDTH